MSDVSKTPLRRVPSLDEFVETGNIPNAIRSDLGTVVERPREGQGTLAPFTAQPRGRSQKRSNSYRHSEKMQEILKFLSFHLDISMGDLIDEAMSHRLPAWEEILKAKGAPPIPF